jgi:hypothetical protein
MKTPDKKSRVKQTQGLLKGGKASSWEGLREATIAQLQSRSDTGLCLAEVPLFYLEIYYICDWLVPSQLPTEPSHLPYHIFVEKHSEKGWSACPGVGFRHPHLSAEFSYLGERVVSSLRILFFLMPLQISASKMSPSSKIESPLSFVTI